MCVHCIGGTNINTCLCVPRLVCIFILPCVSVCSSENEWVHVCVYVCVCMWERVHVCVPQKATEEDVEECARASQVCLGLTADLLLRSSIHPWQTRPSLRVRQDKRDGRATQAPRIDATYTEEHRYMWGAWQRIYT